MRLRYQLLLLIAVSALPFLLALPWALREVRESFDEQLERRLEAASRATRESLKGLATEVERSVRDLATDSGEEIAKSMHEASIDRASLVPKGERLMALLGLDVLEILDADGQVLTSGHLPAKAGDPDLEALQLGRESLGRAVAKKIEIRTGEGIGTALAIIAARPVEYGTSRIYVVGGRLIGGSWANQLSDLSGVSITVQQGGGIKPSQYGAGYKTKSLDIVDSARSLGTLWIGLSDEAIRSSESKIMRRAPILWAVSLAIAVALGLILAARIGRPVGALVKGTKALAHGELGQQISVKASGEVRELVTAFNSMSREIKSTTERAVAAERIAAWQEIARRLAHEIKNPLTPIRMSLETMLAVHRRKGENFDEIFSESTTAALEEVERLRRIIDEFSRFARLPKPELVRVDVGEVVDSVLAIFSSPREGLEIERAVDSNLWAHADSDQISQVLINLITNADQAMPKGGKITVRALRIEDEIAVEVEDQGPGINPASRGRIFEPYFTTKEGGTGLGLAIGLKIAQEHRGKLEELGREGQGARFRLTLPKAN